MKNELRSLSATCGDYTARRTPCKTNDPLPSERLIYSDWGGSQETNVRDLLDRNLVPVRASVWGLAALDRQPPPVS